MWSIMDVKKRRERDGGREEEGEENFQTVSSK
jgi:hypothetical protein